MNNGNKSGQRGRRRHYSWRSRALSITTAQRPAVSPLFRGSSTGKRS